MANELTASLPANRLLDDLFLEWLSLPETDAVLREALQNPHGSMHRKVGERKEPAAGREGLDASHLAEPRGRCVGRDSALLSKGSPPRSPRGPSAMRTLGAGGKQGYGGHISPMRLAVPSTHRIKQFYFPNGKPMSPVSESKQLRCIEEIFRQAQRAQDGGGGGGGGELGMAPEDFVRITTDVCGLSSYANAALFARVDATGRGYVTLREFVAYFNSTLKGFSTEARLFHILLGAIAARGVDVEHPQPAPAEAAAPATPQLSAAAVGGKGREAKTLKRPGSAGKRRHLVRSDLRPIVDEVVRRHPGLEFLKSFPEFQVRYVQTVIARIFYTLDKSGKDRITLQDLRRSNLCRTLCMLDEEEDINKINDYFSYEHFYVIYCKFWELDEDHDFLIDEEDLIRYNDYALTSKIVKRILSVGKGRGGSSGARSPEGTLNYEDFIVFLISEIDKSSEQGTEYWLRCVDLDSDGVIAAYEVEYFFHEQLMRIQTLSQEEVRFEDILCQLNDMVKPREANHFRKRDLRRSKMAGPFFNMLFNLTKHIASEQRDPVLISQVHKTPDLSDWDRYAISEYYKLAETEANQEAEAQQQQQGGGGGWHGHCGDMDSGEDGQGGATDNFLWGAECPEEEGEEGVGGMMTLDDCDDEDDAELHLLPEVQAA